MPNIKSAKKRVLVSTTKHDRNQVVRSAVKTRITRVRRLLDGGVAEPTSELRLAVAALDKAAERGILHPNNAARRKSRLMRSVHRAAQLAADPEAAARAAAEARSHAKGSGKAQKGSAAKAGGGKAAARKGGAKASGSKGGSSRQ